MKSIKADIGLTLSRKWLKLYYPSVIVLIILGFTVCNDIDTYSYGTRYIDSLTFFGIEYYWSYTHNFYFGNFLIILLIIAFLLAYPKIIEALFKAKIKRYELQINEEKAYGSYGKFSKREFNIPIEKIDNIFVARANNEKINGGFRKYIGLFISEDDIGRSVVSVSSGNLKISFPHVKNADEVVEFTLDAIKQYKAKYGKVENVPVNTQTIIETSEADELGKFKKLLDDGVITQEEFDAKKKQILGL